MVEPQAERRDDPLDRGTHCSVVLECAGRRLKVSAAVHPDVVWTVDEHVRDLRIPQEPLDRTEADERVDDSLELLSARERRLLPHGRCDHGLDVGGVDADARPRDGFGDSLDHSHDRLQTGLHARTHRHVGSIVPPRIDRI